MIRLLPAIVVLAVGVLLLHDRIGTPTPSSATIRVSIVLRVDRPGMVRALDRLRSHRATISQRRLTALYAPSVRAVGRLRQYLIDRGVEVGRVSPSRMSMDVVARPSVVERLFGVRLTTVRDSSGRAFVVPTAALRIPPALRSIVSGVAGLSTRSNVTLLDAPPAAPAPVGGALTPREVNRAYGVAPLHRRGITGAGVTVAILVFGRFSDRDVGTFSRRFHVAGPSPEHVPVDGGSEDTTGLGAREATMDVEILRAVAPAARILVYELPTGGPGQAAEEGVVSGLAFELARGLDRVLSDGRAQVVSVSEGVPDVRQIGGLDWLDPADRVMGEDLLAAAALRGITVFAASGDHGAYGCQSATPVDHRLCLTWPGDSPAVVSVGGTRLTIAPGGRFISETGWQDVLQGLGSGGGGNRLVPAPSWQTALFGGTGSGDTARRVPDVAADADPDTPFAIVFGDDRATQAGYGTSAATPFWAGVAALARAEASRRGVTLGFLAPALYRVAATKPSVFHDVVAGGNRHYRAGRGWDYVTGFGSPDADSLVRALVTGR